MNRSRIISAALLASVMGGAVVTVALPLRPAMAEEKKVSQAVGKPLQAALELAKVGKFKEALGQVAAADAASGKTAYDEYKIEQVRENIAAKANDWGALAHAAEVLASSPESDPADRLRQRLIVVQAYDQMNNPQKVIEAANAYFKDGGTDESQRLFVAQAYSKLGDNANAAKTIRQVIQNESRNGGKPPEQQLVFWMGTEYKIDQAGQGYIDALGSLAQYYPKKEYWHDLILAVQKKPAFNGLRLALDVSHIKLAVGAMTKGDDFVDAAENALQAGFPGDAKAILDKGYAAGVFDQGGNAARTKKLSDMANRQAADDVKTLAGEQKAAQTGDLLVKLGDAYASYGQYDNAISAYQAGIAKGGLKYPEDAKLHLGIAELEAGQKPAAQKTLKSVAGADGTADLAKLWLIEGGIN